MKIILRHPYGRDCQLNPFEDYDTLEAETSRVRYLGKETRRYRLAGPGNRSRKLTRAEFLSAVELLFSQRATRQEIEQ